MLNKAAHFMVQLITAANIIIILLMVISAYNYFINPAEAPLLSVMGLLFPLFLCINVGFFIFWLFFHVRMLWLPIVGFLLCIVPIRWTLPINLPLSPPRGSIKILSYNVLAFGQDLDKVDECLRYLGKSQADIICIQEANATPQNWIRVDSVLADYPYKDTLDVGQSTNMMATYSKFPILSAETIDYYSKGNGSRALKVLIDGDTVLVINNHLESNKLNPSDKQGYKDMIISPDRDTIEVETKRLFGKLSEANVIRSVAADSIAAYIARSKCHSIIVCGDFNTTMLSYVYYTISKGLQDAFIRTGNGLGISYYHSGFYVRIDQILCSKDWHPFHCIVDRSVTASDHYPIWCYLKKVKK